MSPPVGYIKFGSLLHLFRSKKIGTDPDQQTIDDADEPLRKLLLNGEIVASVWDGKRLDPVPVESWDEESFVMRACAGWPVTGGGIIVLQEKIVDQLALQERLIVNAPTESSHSLVGANEKGIAAKLGFHVSIYVDVMLAWSQAAGPHKDWTKKEIHSWLKKYWPAGVVRPTNNELAQMAGLCRNKEDRRGGVKKNADIQRRKKHLKSKP